LKLVKLVGLVSFCGLSVVATNAMAAGEHGNPSSNFGLDIERLGELILGKKAGDAADEGLAPTITPKVRTRLKRVKPLRYDSTRRSRYVNLAKRYAKLYGVPFSLVDAVMRVESRYQRAAYNGGAVGLMQIKPRTARDIGYSGTVSGLYAPETNIKYGVKYLAGAFQRAEGDICGTIMRYQSGYYARRINGANLAYCAKVQSIMVSLDLNTPA
jgi:soluble lytic murein transglycosylase-like protein